MDTPETVIKRLAANAEALHISRVPTDVKREFKRIAEDEFCDDHGMLLRDMMEKYLYWREGMNPKTNVGEILIKLQSLEKRVEQLEQVTVQAEPQDNIRRSMSGEILGRKR